MPDYPPITQAMYDQGRRELRHPRYRSPRRGCWVLAVGFGVAALGMGGFFLAIPASWIWGKALTKPWAYAAVLLVFFGGCLAQATIVLSLLFDWDMPWGEP